MLREMKTNRYTTATNQTKKTQSNAAGLWRTGGSIVVTAVRWGDIGVSGSIALTQVPPSYQ